MEAGAHKPSEATGKAVDTKELPQLTVPQWLAFATFVLFVVLAFLSDSVVEASEFSDVKKLAIFLIAALLPSDVLIRYGRAQFMKGNGNRDGGNGGGADNPGGGGDAASGVTPADMPRATLPQVLAFVGFLITVILTVVSNGIITTDEFTQVNEVLRFLIVALLPSEAALRFSRALYLRDAPDVTKAQAKLI